MSISFTGPSKLSLREHKWCVYTIKREVPRNRVIWRSGAARGLDTIAAELAQLVDLYIPDGSRYNADLLDLPNIREVHYINGGYRQRNIALVRRSSQLHAFTKSPQFYRSGEWMTVNIAKVENVPTVIHVIPRNPGKDHGD